MNRVEYEKQLADLKRSNKARKLVLAKRAKYKTVEEYKEALETILSVLPKDTTPVVKEAVKKAKKKFAKKVKPKIHNVIILDNSCSMYGPKFNNAYQGVKDEIAELKKDDSIEYTQTFCYFTHSYTKGVSFNISNINKDIKTFKVPSLLANAGTPLYDSVCGVLREVEKTIEKDTKILIKVFTDGEDMHSKNNTKEDAKKVITKAKELGITVTFVGTKTDVNFIIDKLGIDESNTLVHNNTGEGVKKAFETTAKATKTYSKRVVAGEDVSKGFYKKTGKL